LKEQPNHLAQSFIDSRHPALYYLIVRSHELLYLLIFPPFIQLLHVFGVAGN